MYFALANVVNSEIREKWQNTNKKYNENGHKQLYYLSMEFLIGRLLRNNLLNCGLLQVTEKVMEELGFQLDAILEEEEDAGLGNGGLGRLAACFLDSLASLKYPGHGFGIRYRYGLFEQRIIHGNQVELPDNWLTEPYPWETRKKMRPLLSNFMAMSTCLSEMTVR